MNNLPLQPLVWSQKNLNPLAELELTAYSALHEYVITEPRQGKFEIKKTRLGEPDKKSEYMTGFTSVKDAKDEAWNHYNEKMQPYVKPDSITDIRNWFKSAKPEPTDKDRLTQIGCHYEEVDEMTVALATKNSGMDKYSSKELSDNFKGATFGNTDIQEVYFSTVIDRIELLDALCDQIVTATGVAYMMGFDIEGALKEVIRSNNSKMVDGNFEFDANGKITKPSTFSKPDLTPFIK